jgi:hypothetical protein
MEPTEAERRAARPAANQQDLVALMDVEREIDRINNAIEVAISDQSDLSRQRAHAQADWEEHRDRIILQCANSGERTSEDVRLANAKEAPNHRGTKGHDLYKAFLILKAAEDSAKQAQYGLQAVLTGKQSLLKGLRAATGLGD